MKIHPGVICAAWLFFFAPVTVKAQANTCPGPTKLVTVTAEQLQAAPRTYSFHLENRHTKPILVFVIGVGAREEMEIRDDNMPTAMRSPAGWKGRAIPLDESFFMQLFWETVDRQDAATRIAPGAKLVGFVVEMPPPREDKVPLVRPDGKVSRRLDLTAAPFRVLFAEGTCAWGRVRAAPPPAKP